MRDKDVKLLEPRHKYNTNQNVTACGATDRWNICCGLGGAHSE